MSTSVGAPKDALEQLNVADRDCREWYPQSWRLPPPGATIRRMGKKRARKQKRRRRQINTAGVIVSATPRLDEVRGWIDELHAAHGQDPEPPTTEVADGTQSHRLVPSHRHRGKVP